MRFDVLFLMILTLSIIKSYHTKTKPTENHANPFKNKTTNLDKKNVNKTNTK